MAIIHVPFLNEVHMQMPVTEVSERLDQQKKYDINIAPWADYPYKPLVSFTIAYSADCIVIKYYVAEKSVKATYYQSNDPVYKDSCVEFFVSFGEKGYYNFELNCIGTCLAAFGPNRYERTFLPVDIIQKIKSVSQIYREDRSGVIQWQLMVMLPFDVFMHDSLSDLKGKTAKANFYKCGDDLPQPHYLCWNNISSPQPDFHLPQFFGSVQFA